MAGIRDRIKDFRRVPASKLIRNPKNYRLHPQAQRLALRAMLDDVGYANAVICREVKGDKLQLIDGELRVDEMGDQPVPVLVLDVTEEEADKLLATLDPIGALAETDANKLGELMDQMTIPDESLALMLEQITTDAQDAQLKDVGGDDEPSESKKRPIVKVVLDAEQIDTIERAISATGMINRAESVTTICKAYLDGQRPERQLDGGSEDRAVA